MTRHRPRRRPTPAPLELFGRESAYVRRHYLAPAAEADFIRHQEDLMPSSDPPLATITSKWLAEQDDEDVRDLHDRLTKALTAVEAERKQRAEEANAEVAAKTGERIALLRARAGMERSQLAEAAGLSTILIAKTESGKSNPKLESLVAIATGLGVSVAELLES